MRQGKHSEISHGIWGKHSKPVNVNSKAIVTIIILLLLCYMLCFTPILAVLSDTVDTVINLTSSSISLSLSNLRLDDKTDVNNELVEISSFILGEIHSFGFTLTNEGKSANKVNTKIKIAWDKESEELPEANSIYIYPETMTTEEIKNDISSNNAGLALVNFNDNDQVNLTMNDGTVRKGISYELDTIYLDSILAEGETTELSGGEKIRTYGFKVIFEIRTEAGQLITDFDKYGGENLKIDIESIASTIRISLWGDTKKATVKLNDAIVQIEPDQEFNYTGYCEEYIAPVTGVYRLEVWGAQGGGNSGGKGGYSTGLVNLTAGDKLYVYVGGKGSISTTTGAGFNGGGNPTDNSYYGGGGGSDIRINIDSLYSRVIAAGGGGGERTTYTPGYGGGEIGGNALQSNATGMGATQIAGGPSQQGGSWSNYVTNGSFGLGGSWISTAGTLNGFSGGGGGWYGGGAGHGGRWRFWMGIY